jgi:hypothetical protein
VSPTTVHPSLHFHHHQPPTADPSGLQPFPSSPISSTKGNPFPSHPQIQPPTNPTRSTRNLSFIHKELRL